jgi:hypothetical protein
VFSFTDWNKSNGNRPPPGDRLDAQIDLLVNAIFSTQKALAEIRRDDGRLHNSSVAVEQLDPALVASIGAAIERRTAINVVEAQQHADRAQLAENDLSLFARDAEAAAISASQFLSAVNTAHQLIEQQASRITNLATTVDVDAVETENWATTPRRRPTTRSRPRTRRCNGPSISPVPSSMPTTRRPTSRAHRSRTGSTTSRSRAMAASPACGRRSGGRSTPRSSSGPWGYYYLGGWSDPPLPGETNPNTGIKVPNPIAPGSTYYDLDQDQLYVWNGTTWISPLTLAPGFVQQLVYTAVAGQTVFSGADMHGTVPNVGTSPSDVHVNGVRQIPGDDFTVAGNVLTLADASTAGTMVQWDLMIPASQLAPGAVFSFKIHTLTPTGTLRDFTLEYTDPGTGMPALAAVGDAAQLDVVLDGIPQEPGPDFTASGSTLHLVVAPRSDAKLWAVWHRPAGAP